MGCFLTITRRDFAQLEATLKAYVSTVNFRHNEVDIQVHSGAYRSAQEMARRIKEQVSGARVTTITPRQQERAIATTERFLAVRNELAQIDPVLASICTSIYEHDLKSASGAAYYERGKLGEKVATQILEQARYIDSDREVSITKTTGVDVMGRNRAGNSVFVEVKTSDRTDDFASLLRATSYKKYSSDGKGCRQASNEWFRAVEETKGVDLDLEKATVLGVHINPSTQTVLIYRRMDSSATQWKPLMRTSLSDFHLAEV